MTIKPWRVLESKYLRKNVRVDRCELSNGMILEPLVLEYGSWANVLALTESREAVLVRQYRHAIGRVIWELPGGVAEEGESPLECAKRELLEETGFTSEVFIETGRSYPNPASHTNMLYSFLALDVKKVSEQNLDDTEELEVSLVPLEGVMEMVKNGDLAQALHLTTFFFSLAHLDRDRA